MNYEIYWNHLVQYGILLVTYRIFKTYFSDGWKISLKVCVIFDGDERYSSPVSHQCILSEYLDQGEPSGEIS